MSIITVPPLGRIFTKAAPSCLREVAHSEEEMEADVFSLTNRVMDAHPDARCKVLAKRVRNMIAAEDGEELATALHVLPPQGRMVCHFEGNDAAIWTNCLEKPSPLNAAVDMLPPNYNLHKLGKRTSAMCPLRPLQHVLNSRSKSMKIRCYSERHNHILHILSSVMKCHPPPSFSIMTDLHDKYLLSQHITPTALRPDIVWWSEERHVLWMCALTVPYESVRGDTHSHKLAKNDDLVERVREAGYQ